MEHGHLSSFARKSSLAAYQSVSALGNVAQADPHKLVQMLFDAAAERMIKARACIEQGDITRKAQLLHSCVILLAELRGSLNMAEGGELAQNLSNLYDYMVRQIMLANVENDASKVAEVLGLLNDIRGAWIAIGPEIRKAGQSQPMSAAAAG
jgi:flagellar secretion chaperone FliS